MKITPRLRRIILMIALIALSLPLLLTKGDADASWAHKVDIKAAQEIPLPKAFELLGQDIPGREAAVLETRLLIRTPIDPDAGDAEAPAGEEATAATTGMDAGMAKEAAPTHEVVKVQLPYPPHEMITALSREAKVDFRIVDNLQYKPSLTDRIIQVLPILVIICVLIYMFSRGATRSIGLNSAYSVVETDNLKEDFSSVAGIDQARGEIQEIVDFLKDPEAAARLGGRMPKGALLDGPPGSGKTLLARAMAKEAGVPFITIEAAGVNQLFVGAGAMKIKRAFGEARKRAPCIVFIDEIDALGRARGGSMGGGAQDEKEATLNAILVELDGFDAREGIVLIAATNRPEILDPALTRRGRIDRRISVSLPDITGRREILEVHAAKIKMQPGLDLSRIASTTFGFSGADLAALTNEAALVATRRGANHVGYDDFAAARDRLIVGLSGSKRELKADDRRLTAVHEAGHALIAAITPDADPIEKATILPQGQALGFVMQSPAEDRVFQTRAQLEARIRVAVAGRAAEALVFGSERVTSGAASDIRVATRVARAMVAELGLSDLGFVQIDPQDPLLMDPAAPPVREIRKIIDTIMADVAQELEENRDGLDAVTALLIERETVSGAEIEAILAHSRATKGAETLARAA